MFTIPICVLACLSTLLHGISADVLLTYPASGSTLAGGAITLKWKDSGANPALAAIAASDIILCTGTNAAPTILYTVAGAVPLGTETSLAITIPVTIGSIGQYFLKFVSTTGAGSVVITYSDRFTLTGMTGTVVANSGLAVTGPTGTTPSAALLETAAATATINTATTNTKTAGVVTGNVAVYATQTGAIRSAPLQRQPGSIITAQKATQQPIFPTSAYSVFTTYYGAPVAVTTLSYVVSTTPISIANEAQAATFTGN